MGQGTDPKVTLGLERFFGLEFVSFGQPRPLFLRNAWCVFNCKASTIPSLRNSRSTRPPKEGEGHAVIPGGSATFFPSSRAQVLSLHENYFRTNGRNVIPQEPGPSLPNSWQITVLEFFFFLPTWRSSSRQGISQARRVSKKCAAQQTREQKLSVLRLEGGQMAQRWQEKSDSCCAKMPLLLLPHLCCHLERFPYSPLMSYPNVRCSSIFRNIIVSEHYSSFPSLFPLLHLCQHSCLRGPL